MREEPILVAMDFEEASHRALETARAIAAGVGAPLALVHVYRVPVYSYPGIEPLPVPPVTSLDLDLAARQALAEVAASFGIPPALTLLREGDPVDEILAAAAAIHARMI